MSRLATHRRIEDQVITITLARTEGNRKQAAKMLNMPVSTLQHKIAKRTAEKKR